MKRQVPYVNEGVAERDFKYYIFDWDDNILHMPTKIRMEHRTDGGEWRPVEMSILGPARESIRNPGGGAQKSACSVSKLPR